MIIILSISEISIFSAPFITVGVSVITPWNKNVPIITFGIDALLILAPPISRAATV